jgi:hypothetical protein
VIFLSWSLYIASLFRDSGDLLHAMPSGRFAPSRAGVIFLL